MLTRIVLLILVSVIISGSIRFGFELRDSILYGEASFVRDALKNGPVGHKITVIFALIVFCIVLSPLGFTMILINYNSKE